MSTITREFTKEQLQQIIETDHVQCGEASALARIALASLEAEPVGEVSEQRDGLVMDGTVDLGGASTHRIIKGASKMKRLPLGTKFYTAPPAPVSVPDAMEMDDDFDSAFEHGKAVGWNACRAAMLQGADRPQNEPQNIPENIPATQFKPVADLYGLTSPTGDETSFTFDAVEARDFIDGGWSCQEYVELERFQEAITNHTEDKLAMVDHSGDSNNMVEPVTTAYKLPEGWVAVPVEPTEDMIVNGFESEPDESFSDEKEWEAYDAMSGCQQAAHRARLCWSAMIASRPKLKHDLP
ncbi:hypothetical protein [Enterobacter cloacae]|uniref:hypothetical protein n=1 Tax=Enterobacter cloacae TaxID=550 RepID=UPI0035CFBA10